MSLNTTFFETGISREWGLGHETHVQPVYLVVGLFPRGHANPQERVAFVHKPKNLFWQICWAAICLRGVTGTFFSLKHVKGFRLYKVCVCVSLAAKTPASIAKIVLYKCDAETGLHERADLDSNGVADLLLLRDAYKQWHVPRHIAETWADWIHQEFNNRSHNVLEGKYSLELVLEWSPTRITVVVFFPVLLSLAIGFWLNAKNWTDLATIQTAWGTASYIVTAGGCKFFQWSDHLHLAN